MEWTCTHCGRKECKVYGGQDCEAARAELWERWIKMLDLMAQKRLNAAMNTPEKP